ncbi:MAG: SxtJ family membrane protein [Patescibacteria group bacterium]
MNSAVRDLRNFGVVLGLIFTALGILFLWRGQEFWSVFMWIGVILVLCGVAAPRILRLPQRLWMFFAVILGGAMTRIILVIFFYACLIPLALVLRLFGKRFLVHGFDSAVGSYWRIREIKAATRKDFEKQF